jgi:hypothetical protein
MKFHRRREEFRKSPITPLPSELNPEYMHGKEELVFSFNDIKQSPSATLQIRIEPSSDEDVARESFPDTSNEQTVL